MNAPSDLVPHLKMILEEVPPTDTRVRDRIGGWPNRWTDDAPWPVCGYCGQLMTFAVQLLGETSGGRAKIGTAHALQLFVCHAGDNCEFYGLRSKGNHVALRQRPLLAELAQQPGGFNSEVVDDPLKVGRTVDYEDGGDDPVGLEEFDTERFDAAFTQGFVDKLYGVPVAGNDPERVTCTECGAAASFLGQVRSADDWFIYYLHACDAGHEVTFHATRS